MLQQDNSEDQSDVGSIVAAKPLPLNSIPLSLTCGMRNGLVLADPTLAEEDLMETLVTTVLDQDGFIIGTPGSATPCHLRHVSDSCLGLDE